MSEKKQITITITDLDNIEKVLTALEQLFKAIIAHYVKEENQELLQLFILTVSSYFGDLLRLLGYSEEDFEGMNE